MQSVFPKVLSLAKVFGFPCFITKTAVTSWFVSIKKKKKIEDKGNKMRPLQPASQLNVPKKPLIQYGLGRAILNKIGISPKQLALVMRPITVIESSRAGD